MNSIAADLFTGRTSEVNALIAMTEEFKKIPAHKSLVYDKGAKALKTIVPNGNHVYIPNVLGPASGKVSYTGEEAGDRTVPLHCREIICQNATRKPF